MKEVLNNDGRLCKAIIPDFPLGCRRLTPAVDYLHSLQKPNVRVITDAITSVEVNGLRTITGKVVKVDAIICATGFNVSFRPRNNVSVYSVWVGPSQRERLCGRSKDKADVPGPMGATGSWAQCAPTMTINCCGAQTSFSLRSRAIRLL